MKGSRKKTWIAWLLAAAMLLETGPLTVLADDMIADADGVTEEIVEEEAADVSVLASGICSENITWNLYADGTLELTGTGEMWDFSDGGAGQSGVLADSVYSSAATRLVIGEGITSVGYCAFAYHDGITEIEFPESLRTMGDLAFLKYGEAVWIPVTATFRSEEPPAGIASAFAAIYSEAEIGDFPVPYVFDTVYVPAASRDAYVEALKNMDVREDRIIGVEESGPDEVAAGKCGDNITWTLYDDGLLELTGTGKMYNSSESILNDEQKALATSLKISDGITSIGDYAFNECRNLTGELILPDSITSIGRSAFRYCDGMTGDLILPENLTSLGAYAFFGNDGFTGRLVIPNGITAIGDGTFRFGGYTGNLVIPENVTSIGTYAFSDCGNFNGELILSEKLVKIDNSAFANCKGLTGTLTIPENVAVLGDSVFEGCSSLTGDLILPDSLTAIPMDTFSGCSGLNGEAVIPASVTSVGLWAFKGCSGLERITFKGTTPPSFSSSCFADTSALQAIYVPAESYDAYAAALKNYVDTTLITEAKPEYKKITGIRILEIAPYGLSLGWEQTGFEADAIEAAYSVCVEAMNDDGTYRVLGNSSYYTPDITIYDYEPNSAGDLIVRISIIESGYPEDTILAMSEPVSVITGGFMYDMYDGNATITGYIGSSADVVIPETIAGYPVTTVNFSTDTAREIETLFLHAGIISIENRGLDFDNLSKITVSEENPVYSSGEDGVLYDKNKTAIVIFPQGAYRNSEYVIPDTVTSLPYQCFRLTDVSSVVIPASVASIGDGAFIQTYNLKKITVAEENTKYSSDASGVLFNKNKTELVCCPGMLDAVEYSVPAGVVSLGDYAFFGCDNLQRIDLPEGLVTIGENALGSCSSITEIQIPAAVKTIGNWAFWGCSKLTNVIVRSKDVEFGHINVFDRSSTLAICAPAGSTAEAYAAANNLSFTVLEDTVDDTIVPTVLSVFPASDDTIGLNTEISVKVSDDLGVDTLNVSYSTDNTAWFDLDAVSVGEVSAFVTVPLDVTALSGAETVYLRITCTDLGGNTSETTEVSYAVDAVPPEAVRLSAEETFEGIVLTWGAVDSDDLAGFRVYRKSEGDTAFRQIKAFAPDSNVSTYTCTDRSVSYDETYVYYIASEDICGNTADSGEVTVSRSSYEELTQNFDTKAPSANMILYRFGYVNESLPFDARDSYDNGSIVSYHWEFGDDTAADGVLVDKAFTESGVYSVTLTVTDAAGNKDIQTASITIKPLDNEDDSGDSDDPEDDSGSTDVPETGDLIVTVIDNNGNTISGAKVCFNLKSDDMQTFYSGSDGKVLIRDIGGTYQIGAYKSGYTPNTRTVELINGEKTSVEIRMGNSDFVTGGLEAERMTLDEIVAAGIDVTDPANQFVFKFEIELEYSLTPPSEGDGSSAEGDGILGVPGGGGGGSVKKKWTLFPDYVTDRGEPVGDRKEPTILNPPGSGETIIVLPPSFIPTEEGEAPVPVVSVIRIPGKATWLKDFFEVSMTINNCAPSGSDIVLENCIADLTVPGGLTLMETLETSANSVCRMADIEAGTSEEATWILRGDKAGTYSLHADFTAELRDFDEVITAQFRTEEAIRVRAGDNLYMDIIVEETIEAESDSAIKVGLRNEDSEPYYMPNITLEKVRKQGETYKTSGNERTTANLTTLYPGEEIWFEYIIEREDFSDVLEDPESKYYLVNQVIRHVDGVPLQTTFQTVPPYTISGDRIEIAVIDPETGKAESASYIDIELDTLITARMPDLLIRTYRIIDDEYKPCSMDFTLTDLLREEEKKEKTITGTTNENGEFIVDGYDIVQFASEKQYSIRAQADRAQAVELPVTVYRKLGDGKVTVTVYEIKDGNHQVIPDAKVVIAGEQKKTDAAGTAVFDKIPNGKQDISITAEGYFIYEDSLTVKDETIKQYQLTKKTSGSSVRDIRMSLNKDDSVVIIPYGSVNGNLTFTLKKYIKEGEIFRAYRYKISHSDGSTEEGEFTSDSYALDITKMKPGSRIEFAVVTDHGNSDYLQADLRVVPSLNLLTSLGMAMQNITLQTNSKMKISISEGVLKNILNFIPEVKESLVGNYSGLENEDPEAAEVVDDFKNNVGETSVKTKAQFVWAAGAEFDYSKGEYTVFLDLGNEKTFQFNVDGKPRTAGSKDVGDEETGLNFNNKIIFRYDQGAGCWKWSFSLDQSAEWKMIVIPPITLAGSIFALKLKADLYGEEKMHIEFPAFALTQQAGVSDMQSGMLHHLRMSDTGFTLSGEGGIKIKLYEQLATEEFQSFGIYLQTGIGAKYTHPLSIDLGLNFEVGWENKFLFLFNSSGKIIEKELDIVPYAARLRALASDPSTVYTIETAPETVEWNEDCTDGILQSEVFSGAHQQIVSLENDTKLMVFADTDASFDADNPVKLKYSVNTNGRWSEPAVVCEDATVDLEPSLTRSGDGAVLVWTDMGQELSDVSTMTTAEIRSLYETLEIRMAEFDGASWSEPVTVSVDETAGLVHAPVAASDGQTTMVAWLANENGTESADAEHPDTIRYALITEDRSITSGELAGMYSTASNLALTAADGTYMLTCTAKNADGEFIAYQISYNAEEETWNPAEQISSLESRNLALAADEDGVIYYIMEGRLYRADDERNIVLAASDMLSGAQNLSVLNHRGRTFFAWVRGEAMEMGLYLCWMDENGEVSTPVKLDTGDTERYDTPVLAPNDEDSILAVYLTAAVDETCPDDYVLNYALNCKEIVLEQDISVNADDVSHSQPLYPGASVTTGFTVENLGLLSVKEVTAYICDADGTIIGESSGSGRTNRIVWTVPETYDGEVYTLRVLPEDGDDADESNNAVSIGCAFTDLEVTDVNYVGENGDSTSMILTLRNNGRITSRKVAAVVTDRLTGAELAVIPLGDIAGGTETDHMLSAERGEYNDLVIRITTESYDLSAGNNGCNLMIDEEITIEQPLPKEEIRIEITNCSTTLEGEVGVNFYMNLPENAVEDTNASIRFTQIKADGTEKVTYVPVDENAVDGSGYKFTCSVAAKEMADIIMAKFVSDSYESKEYSYSVRTYAETMLKAPEGTYPEKAVALVKAMLYYGGYAQLHFGYNTDNLAFNSEMLTPEESGVDDVTLENLTEFRHSYTKKLTGVTYVGSRLVLEAETNFQPYFSISEDALDKVTFRYNDQVLTPVQDGQYYRISIDDIAAKDLDEEHIVTVSDGVNEVQMAFVPLVYAKDVHKHMASDTGLVQVVNALYLYNRAANAYFEP